MNTRIRIGKYEIDPILFKRGFSKGCGPIECESTCCSAGVYVDLAEKELILSRKETIKKYMDDTQTRDEARWFDSEVLNDNDFPSGQTIATEVLNNKCVFLNKSGMCSLQIAGTEAGMGRWALKPFYCIAFPISVEDGILTFDDYRQGKAKCCSVVESIETTLVQSCKEELDFVLGFEGYEELLVKQQEFSLDRTLSTIE